MPDASDGTCHVHVKANLPPLLLLHGAGCDRHVFDELMSHLDGLACIPLDLPGRGQAPHPPARTASEAADFVAKALAELGIESAFVLGHSYGGAVALELGLAHPEKVAGLVLVSTGARLRVHHAILAAMEQAAKAGPTSFVQLPWLPGIDRALVEEVERHLACVPSTTTLADWQAANAFDRMARVGEITCPALVLGGTEDELTPPKYARWLAEHLPDSRLVLVEGGGHMLPIEHAREVGELIVSFVADVSMPSPETQS